MAVSFETVSSLASEEMDQVIALHRQLNLKRPPIERFDVIDAMTRSHLMLARDEGSIVGITVLATYRKLGGIIGVIEEVVVDEKRRGQRIARGMLEATIRTARSLGIRYVDLTTRPEREEANKLYQSLGFLLRNTNSYRLML